MYSLLFNRKRKKVNNSTTIDREKYDEREGIFQKLQYDILNDVERPKSSHPYKRQGESIPCIENKNIYTRLNN